MNRFSDTTFQEYYDNLFNDLKLKITTETEEYIIAQPAEDLVKFYMYNALTPVEFDSNQEETIEHKKFIKTIYAREREWGYQQEGDLKIECENIILKIPFLPNPKIEQIFKLRTNPISLSSRIQALIKSNCFLIEVEMRGYGINLTNEQVRDVININRSGIYNLLISKNAEINAENAKLEQRLTQFIDERKNNLDADKSRLNEIVNLVKIPLARKNSDIINHIQINVKPFITKLKPKSFNENYELDREKVIDIIKLLNSQCIQFEKTPKTYEMLDEPNLRDLLLSNLNSVFEGKATGETFNNKGKTDIYLNIDKGNILVAECKFYGGQKLYYETIEQLLGYLTWRHNYGIMINFCNQKNFSKIIDNAMSIITSHDSYEKEFQKIDKAHFISKHVLPGDNYKYVEIHHLYYNLYSAK